MQEKLPTIMKHIPGLADKLIAISEAEMQTGIDRF
jgi:hypothetical protein